MILIRVVVSILAEVSTLLDLARLDFRKLLNQQARSAVLILLTIGALLPTLEGQSTKPRKDLTPNPAQSAILSAFDRYEVVGMPEAHGLKDLDDLIFALVRNPQFPKEVNDIVVECGNSLYQPILDRYIAGQDVPLSDVRKVWRNTTQPMCGHSGFFEQFFPLIRVINQSLPPQQRLRVLGGDPPVDWSQVKSFQDILALPHRDANIASVMEKEVLSKHRKALMLFGTFHLFHNAQHSAVSLYEKDYPRVTFVIGDLMLFDSQDQGEPSNPFAKWPVPSLADVGETWLGALDLSHLVPALTLIDKDCNVHHELPKELQQPIEKLVDAVLYLGPPELLLKEPMPADIALDIDYRKELARRQSLPGIPVGPAFSVEQEDAEIIKEESNPLLSSAPERQDSKHPDPALQHAIQACREMLSREEQQPTK
jgi:hypothetical protein